MLYAIQKIAKYIRLVRLQKKTWIPGWMWTTRGALNGASEVHFGVMSIVTVVKDVLNQSIVFEQHVGLQIGNASTHPSLS